MSFVDDGKRVELKGLKLNSSVVEDGHKLLKATMAKGKGILLQIVTQEEKGQSLKVWMLNLLNCCGEFE